MSPTTSSELYTRAFIADAIAYAETHGLLHTPRDLELPVLAHAPFALHPSPTPRSLYRRALDLTPLLSNLLYAVVMHPTFLLTHLRAVAQSDPFTARLLHIHQTTPDPARVIAMINRYDYFVHALRGRRALKQVEMNTISPSFAALASRVSAMHRYLARHPRNPRRASGGELPPNDPAADIINGLAMAHRSYVKAYGGGVETRCLMVVMEQERNFLDMEHVRLAMGLVKGVDMLRATLQNLGEQGMVDGDGTLYFGGYRISVVYYRCGYTPEEYTSDGEWDTRAMVESSNAVKVPTVAMQLAGTKKIQQVLSQEGQVEKFVLDDDDVAMIRGCFAEQWELDMHSVHMAIENPQGYVLKPQREGGGNNLYGEEMRSALEHMQPHAWNKYVLMERLYPVVEQNTLIRKRVPREDEVVSELGAYSILIAVDNEVIYNENAGTLVRTKLAKDEDGGIVSGVAVLDSVRIVDG